MKEPDLPTGLVEEAADFADTAFIVVCRFSAEEKDRTNAKGDYCLSDEEENLVKLVCSKFKNVVILLNIGGVMDTSWFADNDRISGALVLWNAVEETEKTKDSRLAREFVVALPTELSTEENISLLTEFVQENFVNSGMCADFCIHDTDGHNPHAHIMLTVRPLDENGKWQNKTEKEYLCIKDGEERGFTSSEFKTAQLGCS